MKRLLIMSLVALLGLGLVVMGGCSDDDKELQTGSEDDPEIQFVGDIAGEANFQLNLQLLDLSFALLDSLDGGPVAIPFKSAVGAADGIGYINITNYDTANYWHIFQCSVTVNDFGGSYFAYKGIDSLRFGDGSGYMYIPDESVTSLNIRAHFGVGVYMEGDDEFASIEAASHGLLDLSGSYDSDEFTLNGHAYDSLDFVISNDSGTCNLGMYFNETINDLFLDYDVMEFGVCPPDGDINLNFFVNLACTGNIPEVDDLNVNGNWSANFSFDDPYVNMVYESPTTRWTFNEQCRGYDAAKPAWMNAFKKLK